MSAKKGSSKKYIISLCVDIACIDTKYGLVPNGKGDTPHTQRPFTRLEDLEVKQRPSSVSFLDESKRVRTCMISSIDFEEANTQLEEASTGKIYKCFWDRHDLPSGVIPIGCPVKFMADRAVKSYVSEISKERYTITETITARKSKKIREAGSETEFKNLSVRKNGYYETDGIFCSFNCCLAYILSPEVKSKFLFRNSEALLLKMYGDIFPETKYTEILPAPSWRLLEGFGGTLSIEKFRESFNRVQYVDLGTIIFEPMGQLYEDNLRF